MAFDLSQERGVPLDRQVFTWRELAGETISKLNDDAFTRVRIILMNGIEADSVRMQHIWARLNAPLRLPLARVRRVEHHQQTMVNWLLPADQSPLETTIAFEQVAIEVTSSIAELEPDPYIARVHRFGLLEDFDHLYRFSALMDRLEGRDSNTILQSYTDVLPGRPTSVEHRAPEDDLRIPFDVQTAHPLTKLNAMTITAAEHQTHDYYMTIGPMFADPLARQLYAEIASIEEQHVTQYESLIDPKMPILDQWLLHETMEAYNYYGCAQQEPDARVRATWERFLDYELGHVHFVADLIKQLEKRDPWQVVPKTFPEMIAFESHRQFVRQTLRNEVDLRAVGAQFVDESQVPQDSPSITYRQQLNAEGSPSDIIAEGYRWTPGTELAERADGAIELEEGSTV